MNPWKSKRVLVIWKISGIGDTDDKTVQVVSAETGLMVTLPRNAVDFIPGAVCVPEKLAKKLAPYFQTQA